MKVEHTHNCLVAVWPSGLRVKLLSTLVERSRSTTDGLPTARLVLVPVLPRLFWSTEDAWAPLRDALEAVEIWARQHTDTRISHLTAGHPESEPDSTIPHKRKGRKP